MIATTNEPKFYLQFVNSHSFSVKLKVKKQSIMPQGSSELTETLLQKFPPSRPGGLCPKAYQSLPLNPSLI